MIEQLVWTDLTTFAVDAQQTNTLIITPQERLAQILSLRIGQQKTVTVWAEPQIMSLKRWLDQLYTFALQANYLPPRRRLQAWEARLLWQASCPLPSSLSRHLSELAFAAGQLLARWEIPFSQLGQLHFAPSQLLLEWLTAYQQRLAAHRCIDETMMVQAIRQVDFSNLLLPWEKIVLLGVTEIWPQLQRLLQQLTANKILHYQANFALQPKLITHAFPAPREELEAQLTQALAWHTQDDMQAIGLIIGDLEHKSGQISGIWENLVGNTSPHIALLQPQGTPVSQTTWFDFLWQVLTCNPNFTSFVDFSLVLRSPYLRGAKAEAAIRAQLEWEWRGQESWFVDWAMLHPCRDRAPQLWQVLHDIKEWHAHFTQQTLTPRQWQKAWTSLGATICEPEALMHAQEIIVSQRLQDVLAEVASLDEFLGPIAFKTALQLLKELAQETPLPMPTTTRGIFLLRAEQALGWPMDALWISGLHAGNWPGAANPNPFLPTSWQRHHDLPHATAKREWHYCQQLSQALVQQAPNVVISQAEHEGELPLLPSPLFSDVSLPLTRLDDAATTAQGRGKLSPTRRAMKKQIVHTAYAGSENNERFSDPRLHSYENLRSQTLIGSAPSAFTLETWTDTSAPRLPENYAASSRVFALQAQCPFRANAELRLNAKPQPLPTLGISNKLRGQVLHDVMAQLWQSWQSQTTLIHLPAQKRETDIRATIAKSIAKFQRLYPLIFSAKRCKLESARLQILIHTWITAELNRAPFNVIAQEKQIALQLAQLQVRVRLDRVDELDTGEKIIIDYKTGHVTPANWFGDRPFDLQLPLYAMHYKNEVAALAYAKLRAPQPQWLGVAAHGDLIPALTIKKIPWSEQLEQWQTQLTDLADEYVQGVATVTPQKEACAQCHLHAFCRIQGTNR